MNIVADVLQDQRTIEAAADWQARSGLRQKRSIQLRQDSFQEGQRQVGWQGYIDARMYHMDWENE